MYKLFIWILKQQAVSETGLIRFLSVTIRQPDSAEANSLESWILDEINLVLLAEPPLCLWNSTDKLHREGNPMQMWPYPQSSAIHRNHIRVSLQLVLNTPDVNWGSTRCPSCKSTGGSSLNTSLWWNSGETKGPNYKQDIFWNGKTKRGGMLFGCNTSLETHNMCGWRCGKAKCRRLQEVFVCSESSCPVMKLVIKHIDNKQQNKKLVRKHSREALFYVRR